MEIYYPSFFEDRVVMAEYLAVIKYAGCSTPLRFSFLHEGNVASAIDAMLKGADVENTSELSEWELLEKVGDDSYIPRSSKLPPKRKQELMENQQSRNTKRWQTPVKFETEVEAVARVLDIEEPVYVTFTLDAAPTPPWMSDIPF